LAPVALAFAVLDLTGSVSDLGIVLAARTAALIVFVLFGRVWADRLPRQQLMLASDALFAELAAHAPLPIIVGTALVDGGSGTLFNVLWFTALQREIRASELSRVSSWDYLGSLALQPVGQALAEPVAAAIGVSSALYGAGALFLVLLLATLAVPAVRNFAWRSQIFVFRTSRGWVAESSEQSGNCAPLP
jgi:hypothetical protein